MPRRYTMPAMNITAAASTPTPIRASLLHFMSVASLRLRGNC